MEPTSEITNRLAESKTRHQPMQRNDVAAGRAACVALEMPVRETHPQTRIPFLATFV
jgi:hypothetical protein